jgi:hypothetical protein
MNASYIEEWPRLIHTSTWFYDVENPNRMTFDDQESFETHLTSLPQISPIRQTGGHFLAQEEKIHAKKAECLPFLREGISNMV